MNESQAKSRSHRRIYAALDLGTNNCRLLIARPEGSGFRVVDAFSRIVRLGEGVAASGRLGEEAMARTLAALGVCAGKMRRRGVERAHCIATQACRWAENGSDFLARIEAETGLDFEIIEAETEAALALAGCATLLDPDCSRALVFDIGGGSTELTWCRVVPGAEPEVLDWTSLDLGVVNLSEDFDGHQPTPEGYAGMVARVVEGFGPFRAGLGSDPEGLDGSAHLLGTSGTVTTLAAVHLGLEKYQRDRVDGAWMAVGDIADIAQRLARMSYDERVAHPCIRRGRADLVVAGCAIMEAISELWPMQRLRVADRGLREGMLLALMAGDRGP
ncbi:MAG: Ppx/GppA phosphatase family protein [Alphaproteobacteria bacterium]|nr:Ppx/GppA phosphatase family protein [Alphaproteobacteria bacterium]HJP21463.1 Ppx/GppA phosphatase family protein [Alphaproteobacteria bacterium]